jgi:hypothetical protein
MHCLSSRVYSGHGGKHGSSGTGKVSAKVVKAKAAFWAAMSACWFLVASGVWADW